MSDIAGNPEDGSIMSLLIDFTTLNSSYIDTTLQIPI